MTRGRAVGVLCIAFSIGACAAPEDANSDEKIADRVASMQQAIRPTDGTGANGNGFGIPAQVYDPPGGHFRVYYVTTSENAVDLTDDAPKNGVPDFVEHVGAAAEKTYQSTIVQRGFRPPLDDSIYHDRPDFGGDGRFDIYLRWAGTGSDGYRVTEVCTDGTDGGSRGRCAGYFVMNPSYKDGHYPSELDGIQVLTSHELFHSVQDAYFAGQWRTFSEGTAVWNELQVFPDAAGTWKDYLGFLPAFFREPERPLDKSMGSGGAVSYAYATAVFFEFLSERFGPTIIRELWEGSEAPPAGDAKAFLETADALLMRKYQTTLAAAFTEFTRWNLLTGARADTRMGYKRAAEYPSVRFEPELTQLPSSTSVEINGLSARYLTLRPTLTAAQAVIVKVNDPETAMPAAALVVRHGDGSSDALVPFASEHQLTLNPGDVLHIVLTGAVRGARARTVDVELSPTMIPVEMEEEGGCSVAGKTTTTWPLAALLLLGLTLRRRRASN